MFAARGIAVSFSVFVLVYLGLSLAVACAWRRLWGGIGLVLETRRVVDGRQHRTQRDTDFRR